ncbi:MAG: hypothetical protein GYA50_03810 [Eubacteriaceae bacterium]|nr:hypothetical protein [Eubacteriaceae bacterium]
MNYKEFLALVKKGECKNVDYKLTCNAFTKLSDSEKAKAELIKDIIAMSNNGNIASYVIIGVSNNRQKFQSVDNEKLTDDNLQTLCKDNIFPIPRVKLYNYCWENTTNNEINGVLFKIIKIGPQARNCFRFSKDHIDYSKYYCFKKNEVWLRREATSDLASPEEIKYLLEGKDPIRKTPLEDSIDYTRLPANEWRKAVFNDLRNYALTINANFEQYPYKKHRNYDVIWKLTLKIRDNNMVLAVIVGEQITNKAQVFDFCKKMPFLYHGILIISQKGISPSSLEYSKIKIQEKWGWFATYSCKHRRTTMFNLLYDIARRHDVTDYSNYEVFCICLKNIKSTEDLFFACQKYIESISNEDDIFIHIKNTCDITNKLLLLWKQEGCAIETGETLSDYYISKIKKGEEIKKEFKKNEFYNIDKYGDKIMVSDKETCILVGEFLQ